MPRVFVTEGGHDNVGEVPAPVQRQVRLVFHVDYNTAYGQEIFVVGASLALGCWEPAKGVKLTFAWGGHWSGIVPVPVTNGHPTAIHYKYALRQADGSFLMEGGPERTVLVSDGSRPVIDIHDAWHAPEHDPLESSAFTHAIYGRPAATNVEEGLRSCIVGESRKTLTIQLRTRRLRHPFKFCVVGSLPALGAWDSAKAVVMCDSDFPVWRVVVDLEKLDDAIVGKPIEYKYGVFDTDKNCFVAFEDGENRSVTAPAMVPLDSDIVVTDNVFRAKEGDWRGAGVALPVFALRSDLGSGVGEYEDLIPFCDWAKKVGMAVVQLLPINDTVSSGTFTDSYPYGGITVFGLNPLMLRLQSVGTLEDEERVAYYQGLREKLNSYAAIDYEAVMAMKWEYLHEIFAQDREKVLAEFDFWNFIRENEEWLLPYAVFCSMRDEYHTVDYNWWPNDNGSWAKIKHKYTRFVEKDFGQNAVNEEFDRVAFHFFVQWHCHRQMSTAAEYARKQGIVLKGDLPIGVTRFSVDTWVDPSLFNLQYQTGAPPDAFSASGQNWGFPTYNWNEMAKDNYRWWRRRLGKMSEYFDAYRIDHILGFFRIWEIPGEAVDGMLGQFSPAWPLSVKEMLDRGLVFDRDRFCLPYIREHMLYTYLGGSQNVQEAKLAYLDQSVHDSRVYSLKPMFSNQKLIFDHFASILSLAEKNGKSAEEIQRLTLLRDGLMSFCNEVLFMPARVDADDCFTPRISMQFTQSFKDLDWDTQRVLNEIYTHYFFERQEPLWEAQAWKKLPALLGASDMLVCGEDLGMVPACVPPAMEKLGILSLNVQRMPKDPKHDFFHPNDAAYMSVVTTSSHDTSQVREWWEEDRDLTNKFWAHQMGRGGFAPEHCDGWIATEILKMHLYSPAMLAIFPLQDFLAVDEKLRLANCHAERINVPANPKHYWRFRFHLSVDELQEADEFNGIVTHLLKESGRVCEIPYF